MTKEEIEKLLVVAPRYGIEIRLPHRGWSSFRCGPESYSASSLGNPRGLTSACARVDADLRAYRKQVGKEPALGVICRLAGCGPVQPNRRATAKGQVHSDEKAEDHVTLTHRTREKEHRSNQQSETGK